MNLIRKAASEEGWTVDLGECARIWTGGCIIRAGFLDDIKRAYDRFVILNTLSVSIIIFAIIFIIFSFSIVSETRICLIY